MKYSIAGQALKLSSAEDMRPHVEALLALETCTVLDMSGNTLGVEASRVLAEAIENPRVRDHLLEANLADLYTSRLVDEVVESLGCLVGALLKCEKLHTVDLSDNALGLRTIDHLERFIGGAKPLRHLYLSNNGMGPFAGERIGKALHKLAKVQAPEDKASGLLQTFVCGRNRLENGAMPGIALGLRAHGAELQCVRLFQNGIRPRGIAQLLDHGLCHVPTLRTLDLQDNTCTLRGSQALARTLPRWATTLEELNLNDCLLKGLGASQVLAVLKKERFPRLHTLKLEYNEITQQTLEEALVAAIEADHLPQLHHLEINGNRFEEDSTALNTLADRFDDLELDDLEEEDSDEEEDEDDEESDAESDDDADAEVDALAKELAGASI
ncbi:GTPase-activating protein RNA1 KNAG_0J00730 [Huiozyma naganishii CBS 8797]|uniref:Ran GTPase-activating protein 1 n=1 Tax=Huiozyma naganishii (strain ATCC MYA-139 / BCRC 22969 / CBS 8797 / KCTC 17520 / NBRC 10181 / NCYC 3082 / Yp74L-3) TaxID=1071383 RepID=J7SAG9_HUIN7|nr:hypothetical protein KNAG_0J00730 [Kazachstania naganishii CBS 8797]CCK72156.1 hypothetical protein KNAG_0J00730 [Kazachstania naganishii CBS 8797]